VDRVFGALLVLFLLLFLRCGDNCGRVVLKVEVGVCLGVIGVEGTVPGVGGGLREEGGGEEEVEEELEIEGLEEGGEAMGRLFESPSRELMASSRWSGNALSPRGPVPHMIETPTAERGAKKVCMSVSEREKGGQSTTKKDLFILAFFIV
jgi:hypothetical protein